MEHMISPIWTVKSSDHKLIITKFITNHRPIHSNEKDIIVSIINLYFKPSEELTIKTEELEDSKKIQFKLKLTRFNHKHKIIRSGINFYLIFINTF